MFKSLWCVVVLCLCLMSAAVSARAQTIYDADDRGPIQLAGGFQYQHYTVLGRTFHTYGANEDFAYRVTDVLDSVDWKITGSLEGAAVEGYHGLTTGGFPTVRAKSVFIGGGPRLMLENKTRIEPWAHVLLGWQHFRFNETAVGLGSNSAFGFMAGGGVDIKLMPHFAWRGQVDYLASTFQSTVQSNYSFGTGIVFDF
jgi:hypothetical protein